MASYEHDRWSRWQKYLFDKCIIDDDENYIIPKEYVKRWKRQINTDYLDLTEEEKESDRREAIRILDCLKDDNE